MYKLNLTCRKMCCGRTLQFFVVLISVTRNLAQHETDYTPTIGGKGTKCYDNFNRPQVLFIHFNFH